MLKPFIAFDNPSNEPGWMCYFDAEFADPDLSSVDLAAELVPVQTEFIRTVNAEPLDRDIRRRLAVTTGINILLDELPPLDWSATLVSLLHG